MQNNRSVFFMKFRDWNLSMYNRLMTNTPYLDMDTYFKDHSILEDNWMVIKEEIESIINKADTLPKFHEVDKGQEFISDNDGIAWSMFNVKTYGFWHASNIKQCPKTVGIIKSLKNVSGVYFSILDAGKHIPAHNGPYKGILRYQLALSVPKSGVCQIFVDNKPYSWTEGEGVLFDDTYIHEVKNETSEKRIALLLDVRRTDFPFLLKIYDFIFYKIIQLLVVLNGTMKKSTVKKKY
jgi:aspartyl/asparaginyl beta-hydroxylase (cupin superfamily)